MTTRKTSDETRTALARHIGQLITDKSLEKAQVVSDLVEAHEDALQAETVESIACLCDSIDEQMRTQATPLPEGEERTSLLSGALILIELARRLRTEVIPAIYGEKPPPKDG